MIRALTTALVAAALLPVAAFAFPDGAPWSSLDDPQEACASCHFGSDPVPQSDALTVEGATGRLSPNETYTLTVRFGAEQADLLGFFADVQQSGRTGGVIIAGEGLEARGAAIRSIVPARAGAGVWTFDWTTPETPGQAVMHIAGVAANDDASPLGDVVYLKTLWFEIGQE